MKESKNKVDSIEPGLKGFRKVHVRLAFLINDDKSLSSLLNLQKQFYFFALLHDV